MLRGPLPRVAPLLLLAAGCLDDHHAQLVRRSPVPAPTAPARQASRAPSTEAAGRRVISAGKKLLDANPRLGMRPVFLTAGSPHPEVFHQGGRLVPYRVFVSEALVNRCKSDDELAAVLALQLGRMVTERQVAGARGGRDDGLPASDRIGNDADSTFGGPDGTRLMEAAKRERQRADGAKARPPEPAALAREYLRRAGYDEAALEAVAPLLREAEDHDAIERQMRPAPGAENRAGSVLPPARP